MELLIKGNDVGRILAAVGAPRCPEVNDNILAFIVSESYRTAAKRRNGKVRCRRSNLQKIGGVAASVCAETLSEAEANANAISEILSILFIRSFVLGLYTYEHSGMLCMQSYMLYGKIASNFFYFLKKIW